MTLPEVFATELEIKRARLADAKRQIELMEAELRGWQDAAQLLASVPFQSAPMSRGALMAARLMESSPSGGAESRRGPNNQWRAILAATVKEYPEATSLDGIEAIATKLGTPLNRHTIRSQASIYANQGVLERVGQGNYRLTTMGASVIGVTLPDAQPGSSPALLAAIDDLVADLSATKPTTESAKEDEG